MTIAPDISKADLIVAIGRALMSEGRADEAALFYQLAAHARAVQEVMQIIPDGIVVEVAA